LLEGKSVNLRIMEREDLPIVKGWDNDIGIMGEYEPIVQETKADLERQYEKLTEGQWFFVERFQERRNNKKILLQQRNLERHGNVQHSQRRMERTKNTNKNNLIGIKLFLFNENML